MKLFLSGILLTGSLFAQNLYLVVDNKIRNNKTYANFIDKKNKVFTYVQPLKGIKTGNIKSTFEQAKVQLCKKQAVKNLISEGYVIEFVYIGKYKSVLMRFTDCK